MAPLLADFQDPFGGPRIARVPDFATDHLTADLDLGGFELIGLDIDGLSFGAQAAHTVLAGPLSGPNATPTFRVPQASEFGAQPHSSALDSWAGVEPTLIGLNLATLSTPETGICYVVATSLDTTDTQTPSQVAAAIDEFITSVAGVMFDTSTLDTYTLSINANLHLQGDAFFAGPFSCGPDSIILTTSGDTSLILPESGTLAIINPDVGWETPLGTSSKAAFTTSTVTVAELAQRVKALITGLLTKQVLGP
jgi:hypothetical protein